ncbi:NAD(P)-dependent alcohol dehydrogenase [Pseudomonas amygdali]|uniref:NAD(P)-dependent alcohol dehydrogenase n=1 Tax=Pseudomonas amygdali TaxID=47877 RepID=UPI0009B9862F|nr:NAD(P)-dependent alcohol dehydrogenase [Pseudomonas amygdali]
MKVLGYAALSATDALTPFEVERRQPRADDVVLEVLYCGVCHTDLHIVRNHGGYTHYPVVPGHEVVGRVTEVGSAVTRFRVGDTIGVGCMVDSCQHCNPCHQGFEQHCLEGATFTYNSTDRHDYLPTFGGYTKQMVVSEKFALSIPDGLDLAGAAPLLCAGITNWEPLQQWQTGPGSRVAVVGLGGLGHMALKLAKALGAEVTLFTRSPDKDADARRLGADHVVLSTDPEQMEWSEVGRYF